MPLGETLTGAGVALSAISQLIGSSPDTPGVDPYWIDRINRLTRDLKAEELKQVREQYPKVDQLLTRLEGSAGQVSTGDITSVAPAVQRANMPFINQAFRNASARFGSRSGRALGAVTGAINQSVSQPIANSLLQRPYFNVQALQDTARLRRSLAG